MSELRTLNEEVPVDFEERRKTILNENQQRQNNKDKEEKENKR